MKTQFVIILLVITIILSACVPAAENTDPIATEPGTAIQPSGTQTRLPTKALTETPAGEPIPTPSPIPTATLSPEDTPPIYAALEFSTDFSIHSVPYTEIRRGGPSKDGIPSIDDPRFFTIETADNWLKDNDPVIFILVNDDARAYPLQILVFHEIVNDIVGELPLTITYCPLCNTAIAFERKLDGKVLVFGTTGRLRYSNLIMYDRQTESWWQQAEGRAIAGALTGAQLAYYPAPVISWLDFKTNHPQGKVLSYNTGFDAPYGLSPYVSYDHPKNQPSFYQGPDTPDPLAPLERVLGISLDGESATYPFSVLMDAPVIMDQVGGNPIVIFWQPDTFSVLDEQYVWDSRNVGSAVSYKNPEEPGLQFFFDGENFMDKETGSTWNFLGKAIAGPLEGQQLEPILSFNHFWFSWAAFYPDTRVFQAP